MAVGMHCIHCIAATGETLEEACYVHGIDPDDLIAYINEYFDAQKLSSEGEDPAQGEVVAQAAPPAPDRVTPTSPRTARLPERRSL